MRLVVIVPAYNEADSIQTTLTRLYGVSAQLADIGFKLQVYVVDDGSADGTGELARKGGADRVVRHRVNQGLGAAIRTGLAAARQDGADVVVKFDADLQHEPSDILALVEPVARDEADIVYGNRFERIEYRMPVVRRAGNIVFTRIMRWLTKWPLRDSQPGIFAVSRAYLEVFYLPGDYNYTQQVLLDAYHKGMRFAHVPVTFRSRESGQSFVSLRYPFRVLPQILLLLVALRPLKVFGPIGALFLLIGGGVFAWDLVQWSMGRYGDPAQHANAIIGFSLFGLQTLFFGVLAHLVIQQGKR